MRKLFSVLTILLILGLPVRLVWAVNPSVAMDNGLTISIRNLPLAGYLLDFDLDFYPHAVNAGLKVHQFGRFKSAPLRPVKSAPLAQKFGSP